MPDLSPECAPKRTFAIYDSHPDPRGHNTPHGKKPRRGVSKDVTAVTQPGASPLPERAHQLVAERLHQIGEHGAVAGLHEGFDRHARDDLDVVAEAGDFGRRQRDADGVVALAGALVGGDVGGDAGHDAVQFRRGALVEGG
jgi:hypothetical protein